MDADDVDAGGGPGERLLGATAKLLPEGGREAASTRAVGAAAGVQAPTIYRLFGDMRGLLDAVAAEGVGAHLRSKRARAPPAARVAAPGPGGARLVGCALPTRPLSLLRTGPRLGDVAAPPAA